MEKAKGHGKGQDEFHNTACLAAVDGLPAAPAVPVPGVRLCSRKFSVAVAAGLSSSAENFRLHSWLARDTTRCASSLARASATLASAAARTRLRESLLRAACLASLYDMKTREG